MDAGTHSIEGPTESSSSGDRDVSLLALDIGKLYRKCAKRKSFKLLEKWFQECFSSLDNILTSFQKAVNVDISGEPQGENCELNMLKIYTCCEIVVSTKNETLISKIMLKGIATILLDHGATSSNSNSFNSGSLSLQKSGQSTANESKNVNKLPFSITNQETITDKKLVIFLFIVLHMPVFIEATSEQIFYSLINFVKSLGPKWHLSLQNVICRNAQEDTFKFVVTQLRHYVNSILNAVDTSGESEDMKTTKIYKLWLPTICKVMQTFYFACKSLQKSKNIETDGKIFDCSAVDGEILLNDFELWSSIRGSSGKTGTSSSVNQFYLSDQSFMIPLKAKRELLQTISEQEMTENAQKDLQLGLKKRKPVSMEMIVVQLKIRRSHLLTDSLDEILAKKFDLKKKLKIVFEGEDGIDLGGLTKEWFMLITKQIVDKQCDIFKYEEESGFYWLKGGSKNEHKSNCFLAGALLGLAIYNSTILNLRLPSFYYRKLLSPPVKSACPDDALLGLIDASLDNLAEIQPSVAKNLQYLLEYDGNVEQDFSLNFTIEVNENGETKSYILKKHGDSVNVTNQNRDDYVRRYVDFYVNNHAEKQFRAFYKGFHFVCDNPVLKLLRPEELRLLINGEDSNVINISALKKCCKYEDFTKETLPIIGMLWEALQEFEPSQKQKFLSFLTGSDRLPIGGFEDMNFVIKHVDRSPEHLPVAHTCFNELQLPSYESKEQLAAKLLMAMENSEGFNLE